MQLLVKLFPYQVYLYCITDLYSRGTNFWDTLYMLQFNFILKDKIEPQHAFISLCITPDNISPTTTIAGADLGGGCRGFAPPPPMR